MYGAITNYRWEMSDGTVYDGAGYSTVNHVFTDPGHYTATLTLTNADGETATSTIEINVGARYTVSQTTWDFGGGDTESGTSVQREFPNAGLKNIQLQQEDTDGQTATATLAINVGPNYDPSLVQWDFGDGESANGPTVEHTYWEAGFYRVSVYVEDTNGQSDTGYEFLIYHANSIASVRWYFGDGQESGQLNPRHIYMPGLYTVTLIVYDDYGNQGKIVRENYIDVDGLVIVVDPESGKAPHECEMYLLGD